MSLQEQLRKNITLLLIVEISHTEKLQTGLFQTDSHFNHSGNYAYHLI
jgi:hypothetical protein